jgi:hypothetical protein
VLADCLSHLFFFSALYTESLFLFWSVACVYCIRVEKWWWAGILGFCAALTRIVGILLLLPFLWEYLAKRDFGKPRIRASIVAAVLIPVGLGAYMLVLGWQIGDPLGLAHAQQFWGRSFQWPWMTVYQGSTESLKKSLRGIRKDNPLFGAMVVWWELALAIVSPVIQSWQIRRSYWVYAAASICVPLFSPSPINCFLSIPRFALMAFPLFLIGALILNRKRWLIPVLIAGVILQLCLIFNFTCGKFVS